MPGMKIVEFIQSYKFTIIPDLLSGFLPKPPDRSVGKHLPRWRTNMQAPNWLVFCIFWILVSVVWLCLVSFGLVWFA